MPRAKKVADEKTPAKPRVRPPVAAVPAAGQRPPRRGRWLVFAVLGVLFLAAAAGASISSRDEREVPVLALPNPTPEGVPVECAPLLEVIAELESAERELGAWIGWGQVSARGAEIAAGSAEAEAVFTPPACPDGSRYPEFRGADVSIFAEDIRTRTDELTPQLELFRAQRQAALSDFAAAGCR
jgi:hypothetical protein